MLYKQATGLYLTSKCATTLSSFFLTYLRRCSNLDTPTMDKNHVHLYNHHLIITLLLSVLTSYFHLCYTTSTQGHYQLAALQASSPAQPSLQ
jgi:hypothetical protein